MQDGAPRFSPAMELSELKASKARARTAKPDNSHFRDCSAGRTVRNNVEIVRVLRQGGQSPLRDERTPEGV